MKIEVYKAPSGQWSFIVFDDNGVDIIRGGGYATEDEAKTAGNDAAYV